MKLIRFGPKGEERPGLWREGGRIVDLRKLFPEVPDIGAAFFSQGWLEKAAHVEAPGEVMDVRIGCPVHGPEKIICLGKNYAAHARETGLDVPQRPLLFSKTANTISPGCA